MLQEQPDYIAYLLRLWRAKNGGKPVWRASLESPTTGQRKGFPDLETLVVFLEAQTGEDVRRET